MSTQSVMSLATSSSTNIMPPMGHMAKNLIKVAPILTALLVLRNLPTVEAVDKQLVTAGLATLGTAAGIAMLPGAALLLGAYGGGAVIVAPVAAPVLGMVLKAIMVPVAGVIGANMFFEGLGIMPPRP